MKISSKILSLPPYISTPWGNVASLHVKDELLIVTLVNNTQIEVPGLDQETLDALFTIHCQLHDRPHPSSRLEIDVPSQTGEEPINFAFPIPIGGGVGMENMGAMLQHNPQQAQLPNLPADLLGKITEIARTIGIEDPEALPKPEPHCNCIHCQVARALGGEEKTLLQAAEESVTAEDLHFRTWDIAQTSEKIYLVSNPLDSKEQYRVFLDTPIGCTCGEKKCEHVRAVLSS
jgi:hypothetical protein